LLSRVEWGACNAGGLVLHVEPDHPYAEVNIRALAEKYGLTVLQRTVTTSDWEIMSPGGAQ